jgi:tyrosine-protein kinase Etk/Wzc
MTLPLQLTPSDSPLSRPETDELSAMRILDVILRNRYLILGCFLGAMVVAAALAWLTTPLYQSTLSLRLDEKQSGLPVLDALTHLSDEGNEISTEMQMLRSRTLAEAAVDSLALQVSATRPIPFIRWNLSRASRTISRANVISSVRAPRTTVPDTYRLTRGANSDFSVRSLLTGKHLPSIAVGRIASVGEIQIGLAPAALRFETIDLRIALFEKTVANLQRDVTINRPQREAEIVTVKFESDDPYLASEVPNVLAAKFLDLRNEIQKTEARSTVRFLHHQIDTLSAELASTEDALRAFREGNRVISLNSEASVQVGELAKLQADRSAKEAEREALTNALQQARARSDRSGGDSASAYRSLIAFPTLITTSASQFLQALNDAENQRAILMQRRTRQDPDVQMLTARIRELEQQLSSIAQTYLSGLSSQIASLDVALARFGQQLDRIPSKELQLARLERQNKVLVEIFTLLQTRLQEAQIAQAVEDSRVRVVDAALTPTRPVKPNKPRTLFLGMVFGLSLGVALAFGHESLDRTVHTVDDMTILTGVPSLGLIPHLALLDDSSGPASVAGLVRGAERSRQKLMGGIAAYDPQNPIVEAYRTLRTNITFSRSARESVQILVFTSPTPGDGKTTTAANLAATLALQGLRVLLVDADLRRGTLHRVFDTHRDPGLSNLLIGAAALSECVRTVRLGEMGSLDVLPSGISPPNPSELMGSDRMSEILSDLRARYDSVIFDSPPLNLVTDAAILATKADGVIIVGRAGKTEKGALAYAAELLRKVRAPVLGSILNDFHFRRDGRYSDYGGYGYYYSAGYSNYRSGSTNGKHTKKSAERESRRLPV